jgi:hypothetical protein
MERSPKIQSIALRSPSSDDMLMMSISRAEKKKLSPTPASKSLSGQSPPLFQPMIPTMLPVMRAPKKASAGMVKVPRKAAPPMIPKTAARDAPLDIPNIYGSASGFLRMP